MPRNTIRTAEQNMKRLLTDIEASKNDLIESLGKLEADETSLQTHFRSGENSAIDLAEAREEIQRQKTTLSKIREDENQLAQYLHESRSLFEILEREKDCGNEQREEHYRKNLVAYKNRFNELLVSREVDIYSLSDIERRIAHQASRLEAANAEILVREKYLDSEIVDEDLSVVEEDDLTGSLEDEINEQPLEYVDLESEVRKAAVIISDVTEFNVERAQEQFARYESLMKTATSREKRADLIREFTVSQMNDGPLGKIFSEGEIINPWFATLDRLSTHQEQLDDIEIKINQGLLNCISGDDSEEQIDIDLAGIALARIVHVRKQLESAEIAALMTKRNEFATWAEKGESANRVSLVKRMTASSRRFSRELKTAKYYDFAEMIKNNKREIEHICKNELISELEVLKMIAARDLAVFSARVSPLRDGLSKAKTAEELQEIKGQISQVVLSLSNFTHRRESFINRGSRALNFALLNSQIHNKIKDDLYNYATQLEHSDPQAAEKIYNLILVFGKHAEVEKRLPLTIKYDELIAKRGNIERLDSRNANLRERAVNNFLTLAREFYLELNPQNTVEFDKAVNALNQYFTENNFAEVVHKAQDITRIIENAKNDFSESFSNAEKAKMLNDVLQSNIIKNEVYVNFLKDFAQMFEEISDKTDHNSLSVNKIAQVIALFNVNTKVPGEEQLNGFVPVVNNFIGMQIATETKIEHQKAIADVKEFLKKQSFVDIELGSDGEFATAVGAIQANKSAHQARELWQITNNKYQEVIARVEKITKSMTEATKYQNLLEPVFEQDYENNRKAELGKLNAHENACTAYLNLLNEKKENLESRLKTLQNVKSEICFEDMSWARRAISSWKFAVNNPKLMMKYGKEHPIKTAGAMIGMTAFAVLAFKITIPIAAAAVVVKLATTAKIATALFGDAALAGAALANAAENLEQGGQAAAVDNLPEANNDQKNQAVAEHEADVGVQMRAEEGPELSLVPELA